MVKMWVMTEALAAEQLVLMMVIPEAGEGQQRLVKIVVVVGQRLSQF